MPKPPSSTSLLISAIALALVLAAGDTAWQLRAKELTPQQRIDQAWEAMYGPRYHDGGTSFHRKGDNPTQPQRVEKCTKRFCEPHIKGLDHLKPFEGSNQ